METTHTIELLAAPVAVRRDPVEEFRSDVRALIARCNSLEQVIALGERSLLRHGFDAVRCTSAAETEQYLVALFGGAGRRRGKIRQVICRG